MNKRNYLYALLLASMASCTKYFNITEYVPTVQYTGHKIEKIEPQLIANSITDVAIKAKLSLRLRFRFQNPYNMPLVVPEHNFSFIMRDKVISELSKNRGSFSIPPKGSIEQFYLLTLDLDPNRYFKEFMGKDNPYAFKSAFNIRVDDYVQNSLVRKAVKLALKTDHITVPFEIGDTLRLPLPPRIALLPNEVSRIRFLGSQNTLDLTSMTPFVDFLLTARIPSPTFSEPGRTVNAADFVAESAKLTDAAAPQKWTAFKENWNRVKGNLRIEYPGLNTTGYTIYVPFGIHNPNEFPIEPGHFTATARYDASYNPFNLEFRPESAVKTIPAKSTVKYYYTWTTNFFTSGGIGSIFSNFSLPNRPALKGTVGVDLGYGLIQVPYEFPIPLRFGN